MGYHKILWSSRSAISKPRLIQAKYESLGYFYEHENNTAGFVYREGDLEKFIEKFRADPSILELDSKATNNFSDKFGRERSLNSDSFVTIPSVHKEKIDKLISQDYKRYEVLRRKDALSWLGI